MSSIAIVRVPSSLGGTARTYKIFIDGVEAAKLRGGDESVISVLPGDHLVQARIDWSGSDEVPVHVEQDETVSMAVAPAAGTSIGQVSRMFGRTSF